MVAVHAFSITEQTLAALLTGGERGAASLTVYMVAGMGGNEIPSARLERWPWAKTCSMPCADGLAVETSRKARKAYRNRRRDRRRIEREAAQWTRPPQMDRDGRT